jgi:hypothetical protein
MDPTAARVHGTRAVERTARLAQAAVLFVANAAAPDQISLQAEPRRMAIVIKANPSFAWLAGPQLVAWSRAVQGEAWGGLPRSRHGPWTHGAWWRVA